jgi:hypothetical protein
MNDDTAGDERKNRRKSANIKAILRRSIDDARQKMHPHPFRIKESPDFVTIAEGMLPGQGPVTSATQAGKGLDADSRRLLQVIAAVATAIWRMRTKLEGQASAELPSALRHVPRHVQAAWDALAAGDIEVQDPTGQRYVPGMAVNPITFQPMEGVGVEVIHETIKPSVFYKDVLIQWADVIVARPLDENGEATASEPAVRSIGADNKPVESTAPDGAVRGDRDGQEGNPTQ